MNRRIARAMKRASDRGAILTVVNETWWETAWFVEGWLMPKKDGWGHNRRGEFQ